MTIDNIVNDLKLFWTGFITCEDDETKVDSHFNF